MDSVNRLAYIESDVANNIQRAKFFNNLAKNLPLVFKECRGETVTQEFIILGENKHAFKSYDGFQKKLKKCN